MHVRLFKRCKHLGYILTYNNLLCLHRVFFISSFSSTINQVKIAPNSNDSGNRTHTLQKTKADDQRPRLLSHVVSVQLSFILNFKSNIIWIKIQLNFNRVTATLCINHVTEIYKDEPLCLCAKHNLISK